MSRTIRLAMLAHSILTTPACASAIKRKYEIADQYRRHEPMPELGQIPVTPTQAPWDRWPVAVIIHPPIDGDGAYVPHTSDDWS